MQKHNKKRMEGGKDNKQQLYQGTSNADILRLSDDHQLI